MGGDFHSAIQREKGSKTCGSTGWRTTRSGQSSPYTAEVIGREESGRLCKGVWDGVIEIGEGERIRALLQR